MSALATDNNNNNVEKANVQNRNNDDDENKNGESEIKTERVPVSIDEKIAKAITYKELANKKFKKGKYKSAISKYHYVFAYTTGLPGQKAEGEAGQMSSMIKSSNDDVNNITEEQSLACAELHATTNLNICFCYLKLKDGRNAIQYAKKALNSKPQYWKANLRLAEAYMLVADLDQAKAYLNRANELQGGTEKYIHKTMIRLDKLYKRDNKKQKKLYKNMFKS